MVVNRVVRTHWRLLGISSNVLFLEGEEKTGSRLSLCVCVYLRERGRENGHIYPFLHVIEYLYAHVYILT